MNEAITRRPQPGDTVVIGDGTEPFAVLDVGDGVVHLESRHGVRLRAGLMAVRLAKSAEQRHQSQPAEARR